MSPPYYSPPELGKLWGIAPEKVIGFIRRGELSAINLAGDLGKRPRWRISQAAVDDFETARAAIVPVEQRRRKPRQLVETVTKYFRA